MGGERSLKIAIIGAGASGVMAAIKLREAGFGDVVVFEKAEEVGGTWRDNRYPGLTCDVPSHAYRYSFAPNAEWSQLCAPGSEILRYFQDTAVAFDVERFIRFGHEVVQADFKDHQWHLVTSQGPQGAFDVVITAVGVLHHPVYPDIEGTDEFAGPSFHSSRWPDELDIDGKRVGVVGTGSTATQIVGAIVDRVSKLVLFQRTPQWVLPYVNVPITEEERRRYRSDPTLMRQTYDKLTYIFNSTFGAAVVGENPAALEQFASKCQEYLATVRDPELRRKLTPDYKVGCKRLVISDCFYEAVQQPHVELITDRIERICKSGIVTVDGELHELDIIVYATGFNTHQLIRPMRVTNEEGLTLDQAWATRNQGYRTVAVAEFPNWFMIGGPSSPIGNFSWLVTAETQFGYLLQLIQRLQAGDVREIAPTVAATTAFNVAMSDKLPDTVWASGCSSWYIDSRGNISSWPWSFDKFQRDLSTPQWEDFSLA